jgi:hypothetical protein
MDGFASKNVRKHFKGDFYNIFEIIISLLFTAQFFLRYIGLFQSYSIKASIYCLVPGLLKLKNGHANKTELFFLIQR